MDVPYRFLVVSFVICLVALVAMAAPWVHYALGPELSVYDLGSPQLRAVI